MRFTLSIFFVVLSSFMWAQETTLTPKPLDSDFDSTLYLDSNMIQLSGVVVSKRDLNALSYTTVFDVTARRGVVSDFYGYFSFVTFPGDTVFFSSYGYERSSFIVPDTLKDNRYSIIHVMVPDTLNLPAVDVYPWPSKEDFARAFVEMNPYEDAIRKAQRELSGEQLAFAAARLQNDGSYSYNFTQAQRQTQIYTQNQLPANNLLNPYAWAKLFKNWKEGKMKKQ